MLLPILSSAVDTNSLANLQATYFQRLQYQQAQDPSVSASSYTATVDFGFQVPSVVFDHSSQIYIISQSGTSIVFGFGSTDAFAQASAWPQSGIALLVQGQCESDEAHDVYMLNGFIYNGSNLTVAANYSTGQVSNMTSSMNVTFGRYSASDGAGNPKNYTSDVRYVDASFFRSSSSILNNAYYANLNGTNDTILDDEHGVYYTSLTQALLYDLADPQDYDNPSAYELLTEQTIEENEAELKNTYLDPSDIQNATSPDFDNPIDNSTDVSEVFDAEDESLTNDVLMLADELLLENGPASVRRRRRSLRWADPHKTLVRKKRGFLDGLGIGELASKAFDNTVQAIRSVSSTTQEVRKGVRAAVFGGDYETRAKLNLNIGSNRPRNIYSSNGITITCEECQVTGTVDIYGKFNFVKDGISTIMNQGVVETFGNLRAKAVAGITLQGSRFIERKRQVGAIPLSPFGIPGVFNLGPQLVLEIGASLDVSGTLRTTFGAYLTWNSISTKVDLNNLGKSDARGWKPDKIDKVFTMGAQVRAKARVFVIPALELSLDVLNGQFKAAVGFSARGTFGASAQYKSSGATAQCSIDVGAFVGVDVDVFAQNGVTHAGSNGPRRSLIKREYPVGPRFCIGVSRSKRSINNALESVDSKNISMDDERPLQRIKRQATTTTTSTLPSTTTTTNTSNPFITAPVVNIPEIFLPKVVGNFQLALQSDNSTTVIIGNDYNLYLSAQNSTNTSASKLTLLDLMTSNDSTLLIQEASSTRYLHSYGDVQRDSYGRLRTHLATHMPHGSNLIFWSFAKGYLQLNRGGLWQYDTAGCLNNFTGTVQLWLIDGQQGLTALQAAHGNCGLAPLVPINYQ